MTAQQPAQLQPLSGADSEKPRVSVVVPVKDGERFLAELLAAVARESAAAEVPVQTLIIDSGSTDSSVEIAREHGTTVIQIAPEEFSHGPTRNLAAAQTSSEFICFLTQDATPVEGWLTAILDAFASEDHVGAVFGPHLARPETSPMIARELDEFFAQFTPGLQTGHADGYRGGEPFLSNVNAAYRRACWEQIKFQDVGYSEDQAFANDMGKTDWLVVYEPRAAALHAHDYGPINFPRRYFDEYRGLRETTGHIEPFALKAATGATLRLSRADRAWMRQHDWSLGRRIYWTGRSVIHHSSRRVFAALGSRSDRLPTWLQRLISLEKRHG